MSAAPIVKIPPVLLDWAPAMTSPVSCADDGATTDGGSTVASGSLRPDASIRESVLG
jgi:hypothetical protein